MQTTAPFHVRTATEADIPAMAAIMGETFQNGDAVGEFILTFKRRPPARCPRRWSARQRPRRCRHHRRRRHRRRRVDKPRTKHSAAHQRRTGPAAAMKSRVIAGLTVEAAIARGKPKGRHIYTMYLGVAKAWHGYGVAQALVGLVRDCADAEAVAMYGNCQKKLLPFYAEAFPDGVVTGATTLGRGGPAFYFLSREAVGQHATSTA